MLKFQYLESKNQQEEIRAYKGFSGFESHVLRH